MGFSQTVGRAQGSAVHRGPRRKVLIRAQLRAGGPKMDVCIRDISARGMLVQAAAPPPRGTFVEVMCARLPIVGQVVWTRDRRFGVAVRDVIDVRTLIDEVERPGSAARPPPPPKAEVRRWKASAAATFDKSRGLANGFQFAAIVLACVAAAFGIAAGLHERLSRTLGDIAIHL